MIKIRSINDKKLEELTKNYGNEYNANLCISENKKTMFKLFKQTDDVDKKIKKINSIDSISLNNENIIIPNELIKHNDKIIGYIVDYINGEKLTNCFKNFTGYSRKDIYYLLKKTRNILKTLNDNNIFIPDFENVIIYEKEIPCFTSIDNYQVDNLSYDGNNKYLKNNEIIDQKLENYLFNKLTVNLLTRYIGETYHHNYEFKNKEINKIANEPLKYNDQLIIDLANDPSDLKCKIK